MSGPNRVWMLAAVIATVGSAPSAGTMAFDMNHEFSGGANPGGPTPWARATFTDKPAGQVELKFEVFLLSGEFAAKNQQNGWHFNFDPGAGSDDLSIAQVAGRTASFNSGNDAFGADGGGYYDMVFWFNGAGPIPDGLRSSAGNSTSTVMLSHSSMSLSIADFNFVSSPHGGNGVWKSAVHVQGLSASPGSGWIGPKELVVPLPTAGFMGLTGMGTLLARRRR